MQPTDPTAKGQQGEDQNEPSTDGSYVIEIAVSADGSIKVSVEPASEEAQEESGSDATGAGGDTGGEDDEAQSVPNIREAIKLVLDIYRNAGQIEDTSGDTADMAKGYSE
jgi:hypothetical protein